MLNVVLKHYYLCFLLSVKLLKYFKIIVKIYRIQIYLLTNQKTKKSENPAVSNQENGMNL